MKYIKQFLLFWYHFIIGDDWRIAVGVIVGLGTIFILVHSLQVQAWWLFPLSVISMLTISLWVTTSRK